MKRFYLLFTTFILAATLFAEQPFFLKNWIIPENVVWGETNTIPLKDGISFEQGGNSGLTFLDVKPYEQSKVNMPPYLLENSLAGWDMTYEQILNAFKTSDEFDVYEDIKALYNYGDPEGQVTFFNTVVAIAKQNRSFEVIFSFGDLKNEAEKNTTTPVAFGIDYYNQSGINNALSYWDSNTELEKTIIALTAFSSSSIYYVPTVFDCSVIPDRLESESRKDPKTRLADSYSKITNRQELYNIIDTETSYYYKSYEKEKNLLKKYPKKEPYEIAELNNLKYEEAGELYYIKAMDAKIGKNYFKASELINKLDYLRLGVGAGYITREEALKKAGPYVEQILSMYSSYEDFAVHYIMEEGYTGIGILGCSFDSVLALDSYNRNKKLMRLEEINFNGKKRGDKNITSIKEAFYKPQSEDETYWINLVREIGVFPQVSNLPLVKEGISKYGELKLLTAIIKEIKN